MISARKILLIDGDPALRKSFEQVLSDKGYAVTTAASGEDALWNLAHAAYDAVFTELVMRGVSGLDVAEEIHARQPGLPVVIITGFASGADKERATAAGVAEFLQKPLSPEQFADTVERVLRVREATPPQSQTPAAEIAPVQATAKPASRLKDIVLFLLAPLIGLAYLTAFPVFLLGAVIWKALQPPEDSAAVQPAAPAKSSILKTAAMVIAAPLLGVVYAVLSPLIGIGVILWFGSQAWGKLGAKAIGTGRT